MRLLLDTSAFLWIITDAPELSARARDLFVDPGNDVYLSSVSAWEIAVKYALGRFVPSQRQEHGVESLPLDEEAALHLARLPLLHKDPFDRMLVCQAMVHGLVVLTSDKLVYQYPVRTMW